MGREQDLIVAVKNGDVSCVQKLVAKVKAAKTSEFPLGGVTIQLRLLSEYRGYRGMLGGGSLRFADLRKKDCAVVDKECFCVRVPERKGGPFLLWVPRQVT